MKTAQEIAKAELEKQKTAADKRAGNAVPENPALIAHNRADEQNEATVAWVAAEAKKIAEAELEKMVKEAVTQTEANAALATKAAVADAVAQAKAEAAQELETAVAEAVAEATKKPEPKPKK
jgi:hypothetical protein